MDMIHVRTKYSHKFISTWKNSTKFVCWNVNIKSRLSNCKNMLQVHNTFKTHSDHVNILGITVAFSEILLKTQSS